MSAQDRRDLRSGVGKQTAAQAARRGAKRSASLDKANYLATSVYEYAKSLESKGDKYKQKLVLQSQLLETMRAIYLQDGGNPQRQRDYERLHNCQREWIGFRAKCCDSRAVAVPIGCNHRLCVLCNAHRAEHYREKVRELFPKLEIPIFLTLTIPSVRRLTKRSYSRVRERVKAFLKANKPWIKGGIYSLETTYHAVNGWHLHVHILLDAAFALPSARPDFVRFKRRLEFDWLRLTGGGAWSERDFEFWFARTHDQNSTEWNRQNRRVVDVRPVRNREGAAFEVLKYITKITGFVGNPDAVEEFLTAVRGVRMLQTFGSWYGVKFEQDVNKTWSQLRCECGENNFIKIGRVLRESVEMLPDGRWVLKPGYDAQWIAPPRERVRFGEYGSKKQGELNLKTERQRKCRTRMQVR